MIAACETRVTRANIRRLAVLILMSVLSTIRLAIAETAGIAINVVGLALWFYEDYTADATLLIYSIGAVSAVVFGILTVLLAVPGKAPDGASQTKRKWKTIGDFALISFFALGVLWAFIGTFLFLLPHEPIDLDARTFMIALGIVLGFQFVEAAADVLTLRPLPLNRAEIYASKQGLGQIVVLYFGVFIGVIVAAIFGNSWFAVPLFLFKLLIDIAQPIQYFIAGGDTYDDPNANLLRAVEVKSSVR